MYEIGTVRANAADSSTGARRISIGRTARTWVRCSESFEQILEWSMEASHRETLLRLLGRDGFTVDDAGRIRWRSGTLVMLAQIPLGALADASSINEHFDRIAASR